MLHGGDHAVDREWSFAVGDSVLCAVLAAYNFALILWLAANAPEGARSGFGARVRQTAPARRQRRSEVLIAAGRPLRSEG